MRVHAVPKYVVLDVRIRPFLILFQDLGMTRITAGPLAWRLGVWVGVTGDRFSGSARDRPRSTEAALNRGTEGQRRKLIRSKKVNMPLSATTRSSNLDIFNTLKPRSRVVHQ